MGAVNQEMCQEEHARILAKFAPPIPSIEGAEMEPVTIPSGFVVKDSGVREDFDSGMRRDTEEGKPDYTLLPRE